MRTIPPGIPDAVEKTFGEEDLEVGPMTMALLPTGEEYRLISRWKPNLKERQLIVEGADIFVLFRLTKNNMSTLAIPPYVLQIAKGTPK